jgi:hypothetical protein
MGFTYGHYIMHWHKYLALLFQLPLIIIPQCTCQGIPYSLTLSSHWQYIWMKLEIRGGGEGRGGWGGGGEGLLNGWITKVAKWWWWERFVWMNDSSCLWVMMVRILFCVFWTYFVWMNNESCLWMMMHGENSCCFWTMLCGWIIKVVCEWWWWEFLCFKTMICCDFFP